MAEAISKAKNGYDFQYPYKLIKKIQSPNRKLNVQTAIWGEKGEAGQTARELQSELIHMMKDNEVLVIFEEGDCLKADRNVLLKFEYFEHMMSSGMTEGQARIIKIINSLDKETFERVYIYLKHNAISKTGNARWLQEKLSMSSTLSQIRLH